MAKDTFYFSHDYNARNDPKILELRSEFGLEGYGIYWCLIETMAEDDNGVIMASLIGGLSVGFGVAKGRLIEIIDFMVKVGLLHKENDTIFSQRLVEHKMYRKALSDKGKEGAEKRWKNSPPISTPNAKERKGKENKGKKIKKTNTNVADKIVFPNDSELVKIPLTWRDDFNIYKEESRVEFDKAWNDDDFIKEMEYFYPDLDIRKTIHMASKYWFSEDAWNKKRTSKIENINWRSTILNALKMESNKIKKSKQ